MPRLSQAWPLCSFAGSLRLRRITGLAQARDLAEPGQDEPKPVPRWRFGLTLAKIAFLLLIWGFFAILLIGRAPKAVETSVVTVLPNETAVHRLKLPHDATQISLRGPINADPGSTVNVSAVGVRVEWRDSDMNQTIRRTAMWNVYLLEKPNAYAMASKLFEIADPRRSGLKAVVSLAGRCEYPVSLVMVTDSSPMVTECGLIYASLLLLGLYILILCELTDHTFAALLMATTGVAILTAIGNRPTLIQIISWVDVETLMLLIGLMIIVGVMSESGIFDYLAIQSYRISRGHAWPLVFFIAMSTALLSCFLDSVTMLLLMTPIAIRLCEAVKVQSTLVIIVVVVFANIGGALTPVGDPPNVIISTNKEVKKDGINFLVFTMHMAPGVLFTLLVSMLAIYLIMRKRLFKLSELQIQVSEEREATRRRLSVQVADRAAWMREHQPAKPCIKPASDYFETLSYLQAHYGIHNKTLLAKSLIAMTFVVLCFLLHSLPFMSGATLGWVSILGAFLLIILARMNDLDAVLIHVEWSALIFLAGLFVLTEIVDQLGLIRWLCDKAITVINSVDESYQTMVAILLILWISGLLAAFVGNVPVTTMMLKMIIDLGNSDEVSVPLSPLVWALSYGACFGANGTLFGSTANIVGAAIASQYGYRISFMQFFVYGFPMTLISLSVTSVYLLIAHSAFTWHKT